MQGAPQYGSGSRRDYLLTALAVVAVGAAGCIGDDDDEEPVDERTPEEVTVDWVSPADNVDDEADIVDWTGEASIVIEHGHTGDEGNYISEPGIVRIDSGTEVTWEWVSHGHTVTEVIDEGATIEDWDDHDEVEGEGYEHTTTFDEPGIVIYECIPHRAQFHRGAIIVE